MLICNDLRFERGTFSITVNLSLGVGERVALVAPSGQGKSTLLEGLGGLIPPQSGDLLWGGVNMTHVPAPKRPMALVFQGGNVFEHLSPLQNCALVGAKAHESLPLLERVGLLEVASRLCAALSGGQRQRAGIVRAFLQKKPFMLLDEPFSALDTASRTLCYEVIKASPHMGFLFATHDPRDIEALATRILTIKEGYVVEKAP